MTRVVGLVGLLVTLAISGVLFMSQNKAQSGGAATPPASQIESQALSTAAAAGFAPVDQMLQLAHAQNGTYAGAELPLGTGVTVVGATANSYCLQMAIQGAPMHELGPGGTGTAGPC
jgi:uncharacterized iron-regulated membrane protein